MSRLTWGVDGYGVKHYLCSHCEEVFGPINPEEIKHTCQKEKEAANAKDLAASLPRQGRPSPSAYRLRQRNGCGPIARRRA